VTGVRYRIDPGRLTGGAADDPQRALLDDAGFRNHDIQVGAAALLANIQSVQRAAQLPVSKELVKTPGCDINLDVEMETGTGKTYCYIKTMFELYRRYGWGKFIVVVPNNPNVFVICTLKHSDSTISRRQEVGCGLRLAVSQDGERLDDPATVHAINVLTVVASESCRDFVAGLQRDISESLSARPRLADDAYFVGKVLHTGAGDVTVDARMATQIQFWLLQNVYCDFDKQITPAYHQARAAGTLAPLPAELAAMGEQVLALVDGLFSDAQLPGIDNDRHQKENPVNANLHKREFQALWQRINLDSVIDLGYEATIRVDSGTSSSTARHRMGEWPKTREIRPGT
jgi:restriction endonuclease